MTTTLMSGGTVDQNVLKLLKEFPETRTNDMKLFALYYNAFSYLPAGELSLSDLADNYKYFGLPCFETIRRARQRVQSLFPELSRRPKIQEPPKLHIFLQLM